MSERIDVCGRKICRDDIVCISSNYWHDELERKTDAALEDGKWVTFSANCIGHTRARMFANSAAKYVQEKYIGILRILKPNEYDCETWYYQLI